MEVSGKGFRLKDDVNVTQKSGQGTATNEGGDVAQVIVRVVASLRKHGRPLDLRDTISDLLCVYMLVDICCLHIVCDCHGRCLVWFI